MFCTRKRQSNVFILLIHLLVYYFFSQTLCKWLVPNLRAQRSARTVLVTSVTCGYISFTLYYRRNNDVLKLLSRSQPGEIRNQTGSTTVAPTDPFPSWKQKETTAGAFLTRGWPTISQTRTGTFARSRSKVQTLRTLLELARRRAGGRHGRHGHRGGFFTQLPLPPYRVQQQQPRRLASFQQLSRARQPQPRLCR